MPLTDNKPMLEGLRVVDLTSVVFGPYATQLLADLGAEIIKVESPTGDAFRYSGPSPSGQGMAPGFLALNQGKQSVRLDLKQDDDIQTMRELIASADVFIHNVRLAAIEKLGFGPDAVRALAPDIIYVHCVGFDTDGPYGELQAYDDVIQAASGVATLLPRVDGDDRPRYLPSLIADKVAGLNASQATLAALIHKLRTGKGQFVEVPMFEAFSNFMLKEHLSGLTFDPPVGGACYRRQTDPNRQPFRTKDGYISIVPYDPAQWPAVFGILGNPDILKQEQFDSRAKLIKNNSLLYKAIGELTPAQTTAHWVEAFRAARIPAQALRDIDDILTEPQLEATGFFQELDHPTEGKLFVMREAAKFGGWHRPDTPPVAPGLGEHTDQVRDALKKRTP